MWSLRATRFPRLHHISWQPLLAQRCLNKPVKPPLYATAQPATVSNLKSKRLSAESDTCYEDSCFRWPALKPGPFRRPLSAAPWQAEPPSARPSDPPSFVWLLCPPSLLPFSPFLTKHFRLSQLFFFSSLASFGPIKKKSQILLHPFFSKPLLPPSLAVPSRVNAARLCQCRVFLPIGAVESPRPSTSIWCPGWCFGSGAGEGGRRSSKHWVDLC